MAVMLTSRDRVSRTELTLTENISDRGARVVTKKLWSANDSLVIKSLEGDLQSEARVIYRQPIRENIYGYRPGVNRTNGYLANKIQLSSNSAVHFPDDAESDVFVVRGVARNSFRFAAWINHISESSFPNLIVPIDACGSRRVVTTLILWFAHGLLVLCFIRMLFRNRRFRRGSLAFQWPRAKDTSPGVWSFLFAALH